MFASTRSVTRNLMAWARSIPDEEWYGAPERYVPTPEALEFERKMGGFLSEKHLVESESDHVR